jgi:hypothetical protein
MDSFCAISPDGGPSDCDDTDRAVSPVAAEGCEGAAEVRDDDCDGVIDEGCAFHVGVIHSPVLLHAPARDGGGMGFFGPELSPDGLRLYVAHNKGPGEPLWVATRPTLAEPFDQPVPVAGTIDLTLGFTLLSMRGDEREVFVQASDGGATRIYAATRRTPADAFGTFDVVASTDIGGSQIHPTVSRDGLELFFIQDEGGTTRLHRVSRSSPEIAFGSAELIDDDGSPRYPRLWEDGRTLVFFHSGAGRTEMRVRPSPAEDFGAPTPFTAVPSTHPGVTYFFAQAARELWFTIEGVRRDAPTGTAMFRAEVCRSGVCPTRAIDCTLGLISEDGLRCFYLAPDTGTIGSIRSQCAASEALPASIHTTSESEALDARFGDLGYIGLERENTSSPFVWDTGEPLIRPRWVSPEPSADPSDRCVRVLDGEVWDATTCSIVRRGLCVRDLWPSFVSGP